MNPALDALPETETPAARSGAHLAEFRFRFGPEPAPRASGAVARPTAGAPWTLAQTLQEVRLRRVALVETSRGVRPRHPGRLAPAFAEALGRFAGPLRVWLRLGVGGPQVPAPWAAPGWDDATRLHAAWFGLRFAPPALPLPLRPGVRVTDWPRYRASVAERLAAGPTAAGGASVGEELAALYARFAAPAERLYTPGPRPSMAA